MNVMKNILLYAWQLPQNLLGALMFWWYRRNSKIFKGTFRDIRVLYSDRMRGGLSLGEYVILPFSAGWLPECSWSKDADNLHRHEWGHSWQSRLLGWLYLPFVGFQSLAHAFLHGLAVVTRNTIISGLNAGPTALAVSNEIEHH